MNPSVEYIQGDITTMSFQDNAFDFVMCTEVLEYLKEPEVALKELIRVAKTFVRSYQSLDEEVISSISSKRRNGDLES